MAEIPVAHDDMNQLVVDVTLELIEEWAVTDRIPDDVTDEDLETYREQAANDTIFVINSFMEKFNALMQSKAISQIQG